MNKKDNSRCYSFWVTRFVQVIIWTLYDMKKKCLSRGIYTGTLIVFLLCLILSKILLSMLSLLSISHLSLGMAWHDCDIVDCATRPEIKQIILTQFIWLYLIRPFITTDDMMCMWQKKAWIHNIYPLIQSHLQSPLIIFALCDTYMWWLKFYTSLLYFLVKH